MHNYLDGGGTVPFINKPKLERIVVKILLAVILLAVSMQNSYAWQIGPIKITSHKVDKVIKNVSVAGKQVTKVFNKANVEITSAVNGVGKWVNTEMITTLDGKRAFVIKPYIAITHDGNSIQVGADEAHIKIGGLSATTHHLTQRLAEIGCIVASEGSAAMICATEAAKSLWQTEVGDPGVPVDAVGGTPPPVAIATAANPNGNQCKTEPTEDSCILLHQRPNGSICGCFNDKGDLVVGQVQMEQIQMPLRFVVGMLEERQLPPLPIGSTGFNFSNP